MDRIDRMFLATLATLLTAPGGIAIATVLLGRANESAGWLRYRLPSAAFWVFIGSCITSPLSGLAVLTLLALKRRHFRNNGSHSRLHTCLFAMSILAVFAPALWIWVLGEVFFISGGSR